MAGVVTKGQMRRFATQGEAKAFFVERVVAQAAGEALALSPAERHNLAWSESDPTFHPNPELAEQLKQEMTEEEFEAKISGLIKRAYEQDLRRDPSAKAAYREAYSKLIEGDHYIVIMIDRALGLRMKRWWPF